MTDKPVPKKPDAASAFADLSGMLDKVGGADGVLGGMKVAENRSKLINIKLTILLEHFDIDWKSDERIVALKAPAKK